MGILLSLLLGAAGCHDGKAEHPVYIVDVGHCVSVDRFGEFVEECDSRTLHLRGAALSEALALSIDGERVVLLDRRYLKFFVFDQRGDLTASFCKKGNGPGEYLSINCFRVDESTGQIVLLDGTANKIMRYSSEGGFLSESPIGVPRGANSFAECGGFFYFDRSYHYSDEEERFCLFQTDSQLNVSGKMLPYDGTPSIRMAPREPFYRVGDVLVYVPTYSRTVYDIAESGSVSPRFSFDFGKHDFDLSALMRNQGDPLSFLQMIRDSGMVMFLNVHETRDAVFLDFQCGGDAYLTCIDKSEGRSTTIKVAENSDCRSVFRPLAVYDNQFVSFDDSAAEECCLVFYKLKK